MLRFSMLFGIRSLPGPHAQGTYAVSGLRDLELAIAHPLPLQRLPPLCVHVDMPPSVDMWGHWEASSCAIHPLFQRPPLEPALEITLQRLLRFDHSQLGSFRNRVLQDIRSRRDELHDDTNRWFQALPPHIQRA